MEHKMPRRFRQILAVVLCFAMLLPMLPVRVFAADTTVSGDVTFTGAILEDEIVSASPSITSTSNNLILFERPDALSENSRYVIMSDKYEVVMSYSAVCEDGTTKNKPSNITYDADGHSWDTYQYLNAAENVIYMGHDQRDEALWILNTLIRDDSSTTEEENKLLHESDALFGGDFAYHSVQFMKGCGPDFNAVTGEILTDADGDRLTRNGAYWYAVSGNDTDGSQYRFLDPRYVDQTELKYFQNEDPSSNKDSYRLEVFEDGTYLLYYMSSETDIRVFHYSPDSGWHTERYNQYTTAKETVAAIKADLSELKLRLYEYKSDKNDDDTSKKMSVGMVGYTTYRVPAGTALDDVMKIIEEQGHLKVFEMERNHIPVPYDDSYAPTAKIGYYWLDKSDFVDTQTDFQVKVMYSLDDASDCVLQTLNVKYVDADYSKLGKTGIVGVGAGVGTVVQQINANGSYSPMTFTLTENGVDTEIKITVGMLTDSKGNIVDTSKATTVDGAEELNPITGLTLTYDGMVICTDFALNIGFPNTTKEHAWGNPGSVLADKEGTTTEVDFTNSGVANIELSAKSIPVENGVDLIIVMDLSGSMRNAVDGNEMLFKAEDQDSVDKTSAEWKSTRLYAMEQALESMLKTLSDNNADVRVAISDFGDIDHYEFEGAVLDTTIRDKFYFTASMNNAQNDSYEFYNHLNFVMNENDFLGDRVPQDHGYTAEPGPYGISVRKTDKAHPLYTGKITPTVYTGNGEVNYSAFENVDELYARFYNDVVPTIDENAFLDYGTNYDVGLEYAYQLGYSVQQKNIAAGENRQTVCIFLSDGAAMQYNYFAGSSITYSWKNWLAGEADDILTNGAPYTSADQIQVLNDMSQILLTNLQAGDLINWESDRGRSTGEYLRYYPALNTEKGTDVHDFYTLMDEQGHELDWDYLCQMAELNGIENFTLEYYQQNLKMEALRDLLIVDETTARSELKTDSSGDSYYVSNLKCPSRAVEEFYPAYTGTLDTSLCAYDQFMAAMSATLGKECTIDVFSRIAYKNRSILGDTDLDALNSVLKEPTSNSIRGGNHQTYSPYYYFYNEDGKHWMAEAMKGDVSELYPVINKYAKEDHHDAVFSYYGDVRNHFNSESGLALDGQDYISGFRGLDMELYTVMFSVSDANALTTDVTEQVMHSIASGEAYTFNANDAAGLNQAFELIISSMMVGATKAWYTDTMGNEYDLYTGRDEDGDGQDDLMEAGDEPKIQVIQYEMDDDHKPTDVYYVRETITFNCTTGWRQAVDKNGNYYIEEYQLDTPLKAVSNQIMTSRNMYETVDGKLVSRIVHNYVDIWNDEGVIEGKYVSYNTNTDKSVDISFNGQGTYSLDPESFFWTIGVMGHAKFVLEYDVILEGILDGTREMTSSRKYYDTNESARLTYINYLGITRYQEPESPRYPWGVETEVVVDYGLPVYIDVPHYGKGFTLEYVGYLGTAAIPENGPLAEGFAASAKGQFGTLEVVGDQVKYTFEDGNMSMNDAERFAMALLAEEFEDGVTVKNYYYIPVTVVPATTIYYEDNFLDYGAFDENGNATSDIFWEPVIEEKPEEKPEYDARDYYVTGNADWLGNWATLNTDGLMIDDGTGMYSRVYENVPAGNYELKVNIGTWDDSWGVSGGGNYTFSVAATATVTVYFDAVTKTVSVVVDAGEVDDPVTEETYIVAGSGGLCGSNWDPADTNNKMDKGEDGLYSKVYQNVPAGSYEFKVTDGTWTNSWGQDGGNYTFTLESTDTVTVYFDAETGTVSIVIGVESNGNTDVVLLNDNTATQKDYYVTGSALWLGGEWGLFGTPDLMTARENGIYTKVYTDVPAGGYELKVKVGAGVGADDWAEAWGNGAGSNVSPYSFTVKSNSTVIVIFDSINGNINVEVSEIHNTTPDVLGDYDKRDYYVVGGADWLGGWGDDANPNHTGLMIDNGVGLYSISYENVPVGDYELKVNVGDWSQSWGSNGENYKFGVTATTTVTVYFNAVTQTVYVELASGDDISATEYFVTGNADWLGGNWGGSNGDPSLFDKMTVDQDGLYTISYKNVPAGNYELKVNTGSWTTSWGNGNENYKFAAKYTSNVTVKFDPVTGNITVYVVQADDEDAYQDTDRPGNDNLMEGLDDAENVYGSDSAYTTMTTYSLGEAMKVTLKPGYYATATFSFWGTGFDVISLTSRDTGTILVAVHEKTAFDQLGTAAPVIKYAMVDTYYGYKYENGEWVVDPDETDTLYQVPVMKMEDLDYGNYTVVITAQYAPMLDHVDPSAETGSYDFYLDAIRIYDPANDGANSETVQDAYLADGEGWPEYVELRDLLLPADVVGTLPVDGTASNGAMFIDGLNGQVAVSDYLNYGPNNELYLAQYQTVAFTLNLPENVAMVQTALKTHDGNTTVSVNGKEFSVSSTDLYFDLTEFNGRTVTITNTGEKILSITNVKVTYQSAPVEAAGYSLFTVSRNTVETALNELNVSFKDSFILAGANTVLGGELAMNFFINPTDLNGTDYYAQIALYTEDGVVTTTVAYADWEVRDDYLVVTQKGLAARQMADKIEVVIYNGDGTQASDVWTDSIRDYAMRILDDQNDECKTLIVDMLNYGAAAQSFFNYNTDDLANSLLTEEQMAYATETACCSNQLVAGEGYYGSTLVLKDRILLTVYFENITADMYAVVTFTDHKGVAHEIRVEGDDFSVYNSTVYGVAVDELVVADGDQLVTVTVYDAQGNEVATASDTVNSYVARQMGKDALYEMVGKFTASAYAYFH